MMLRLVSVGALCAVSACGDDANASDIGGSTGDGEVSTGGSVGGADGSSSEATTDSEGQDAVGSETTDGSEPAVMGRFLVGQLNPATGNDDLFFYEYDGGIVSEGLALADTIPGAETIDLQLGPARRVASYCARFTDLGHSVCLAADVSSSPPGPPLSFEVPTGYVAQPPRFVPELDAFVVIAYDEAEDADAIYRLPFADGAVGSPEPLVAPVPLARIHSDFAVDAVRGRVAFRRRDNDGVLRAYVATLDAPDPNAAIEVSTNGMPDVQVVAFVPDQDALVFGGGSSTELTELHYVDLSAPTPSAPVRVDVPRLASEGDRIAGPSFAPDGHALLYAVSEPRLADWQVYFVGLGTDGPGTPALLFEPPHDAIDDWAWSPDSEQIGFAARQGFESALYVVDASGITPGAAQPVSTREEALAFVGSMSFDPTSRWLYYAAYDRQNDRFWSRADLAGELPSVSQRISDPDHNVEHLSPVSRDFSRLMYATGSASDLKAVDVSGETPGVITTVTVPLGEGLVNAGSSRLSDDGELAFVSVAPLPLALYVEEVATGQEELVASEFSFVEPLPPAFVRR